MKVDYSKFERDESLYGEVTVKDFDGSEITIKAELVENEDEDIPFSFQFLFPKNKKYLILGNRCGVIVIKERDCL